LKLILTYVDGFGIRHRFHFFLYTFRFDEVAAVGGAGVALSADIDEDYASN
jgi:hypothetical protein